MTEHVTGTRQERLNARPELLKAEKDRDGLWRERTTSEPGTGGPARDAIGFENGNAAALGAAGWLGLAAAPTFVIMALLSVIYGPGSADMICAAARDASPLSGMVPMYLLMSAFHSAPWLKLIFSRRGGAGRSYGAVRANRILTVSENGKRQGL